MKRLRILCSKKNNSKEYNPEITHIGGVNGTGDRWSISVQEAIKGIQSGQFEFYIVEDFKEINASIIDRDLPSLFVTSPGHLHNFLEDLPDCT